MEKRLSDISSVFTLFAALSVHLITILRPDPVRRELAENRSRQCMLGLKELSRSWPVGGWVLRLFSHIMEIFTGNTFDIACSEDPKSRWKRLTLNTPQRSSPGSGIQQPSSSPVGRFVSSSLGLAEPISNQLGENATSQDNFCAISVPGLDTGELVASIQPVSQGIAVLPAHAFDEYLSTNPLHAVDLFAEGILSPGRFEQAFPSVSSHQMQWEVEEDPGQW